MMMDTGRPQPVAEVALAEAAALADFDRVRGLLIETGLLPHPPVYDLFWRYVRDESFDLSLAIERAMAAGALDADCVAELRRRHCGDVDAAEVAALVARAQGEARVLAGRLADGRDDLADYGRTLADGEARLAEPLDPAALGRLLAQLGAATAAMQAANARLEAELAAAAAEVQALAEQLGAAERAAVTDALTGVLNRRGTMEAVAKAQSAARQLAQPLALGVIDIDHFKRFNDRYGHAMGDEVLRFVARHVGDQLAPMGGTVGRLGGEEFVALLPGQSLGDAAALLDRARALLAGQILHSAADGTAMGRVSFSAGVARDRPDDSADALIARADGALYTAKRLGRDRVVPDRN